MPEQLLTPSKITAWLDCQLYLALRTQVDTGTLREPKSHFGSFARLLADKGLAHERDCLEHYRHERKSIYEVPERQAGEPFSDWAARVGDPLSADYDVIYQMPFVHDGIRGIADFVVRTVDDETGAVSYEPVDAKLARAEAKPGHVLQLCFYADAIEALTGTAPRHMHLWLGSGNMESLRVNDFSAYWRRLRTRLAEALAAGPTASTEPVPCAHCPFCEFSETCETSWRENDALHYVAGIRTSEIVALTEAGTTRLADLAQRRDPVVGLRDDRLHRLVGQVALQTRVDTAASPPFVAVEVNSDKTWGRGWEKLPEPDDGDVFLDFEGHPFWRADTGLFFLFGLLERDAGGAWAYRAWWAHDLDDEATAVKALIEYLATRRAQHPNMHVYHYNHTERSALERLTTDHRLREEQLRGMVVTGLFVDLYVVALNSFQVGVESYGLKHLERLTEFQRSHDIDKGAGAVIQYEQFMANGDQADLDSIARYNEDDVRATMALRDWLIDHRPPDRAWRAAFLEPEAANPELDQQIARMHAFSPDSVEYSLGDLLGYWRREWGAYIAPKLATLQSDSSELVDDPEVIAELTPTGRRERQGKKGDPILPVMQFSFPQQPLDRFPREGGGVVMQAPDEQVYFPTLDRLDREDNKLDLVWNKKLQDADFVPTNVVVHDWVPAKPKPQALSAFAAEWTDNANTVTASLLRRELPRFVIGGGPVDRLFTDDLTEMTRWVTQLDNSFVGIQGPPGAGKSYSAAHLVHALIRSGLRVGVTATSHHAITNVLKQCLKVFADKNDLGLLNAVRKPPQGSTATISGIRNGGNKVCARAEFNLIAGTTWLFASNDMRAAPVDVLLVDEAGQLSLADALAASCAARNLIVLGDPLQLPQVAQASHPGISGRSVLEHILGDYATMPADRGVFLKTTWRMHPDVCGFISEQIYEGRLHSRRPNCARQTTILGTGLRWLRATHGGCSTSSPQEAELIAAQIEELIGTDWTDMNGQKLPLTATDFMVVAPYNDQKRLLQARLESNPLTVHVPVGTVDKFQGGEAPVVFFSMTTSSREDMTRSADFLFSRNRLNVAISRARCLAYLVCTEELLNARAHTVEEMRLIGTLNAFVEYVDRRSVSPVVAHRGHR